MQTFDKENEERVNAYRACPHYPTDHTFAICAHGECAFLEENIISLKTQSVPSNIIMCTSTPNDFLKTLSSKYQLPLFINNGIGDRMDNWNFAYRTTCTNFVTLVFQDDKYKEDYCEKVFPFLNDKKNIILVYTDSLELRDGNQCGRTRNTVVKKILNFPLKFSFFYYSKFVRNRILSLGSSICCHSTVYNRMKIGLTKLFHSELIVALDWDMYRQLAMLEGKFIYVDEPVTYHRIHAGEQTTECMQTGLTYKEDLIMFKKFWPMPVAKLLCKLYEKRMDIYRSTL